MTLIKLINGGLAFGNVFSNRIVYLLVWLAVASSSGYAQEICSFQGKSKMLTAEISVQQIAKICPDQSDSPIAAPERKDPNQFKQSNLAKPPLGLHVDNITRSGSLTYADITVKNNSDKFLANAYIEVLIYDGETRVGMTNHHFNSVSIGEIMVSNQLINTGGRPWNAWKYTYKIR